MAVALHGFPFADHPSLRFLWPANLIVLGGAGTALYWLCRREYRPLVFSYLPPLSVWAFLVICTLSVAAAEHASRALIFTAKMTLCFVGAYWLVAAACALPRNAVRIVYMLSIATTIVVIHAAVQMISGMTPQAFFGSTLKLGSFLAMTVPVSFVFLSTRQVFWTKLWAAVVLVGSLVVCSSVWAILGLVVGVAMADLIMSDSRRWVAGNLIASITLCLLLVSTGVHKHLIADLQLRESNSPDLRQRYIEWQAQMNLLKDRVATGTGAGCLNDHRSAYYLRLPKNNTIAAFDQNGWLAVASEMSLLGLICLCWIFWDFLVAGFRGRHHALVLAAWSGVVAVAIAQTASSVLYNGVLVVFVMLLALIDRAAIQEHGTHD